jgi:hypothetical protein
LDDDDLVVSVARAEANGADEEYDDGDDIDSGDDATTEENGE